MIHITHSYRALLLAAFAIGLCLALSAQLHAEDPAETSGKLTEADVPAYIKLHYAKTLSQEREMFAHDKEKRAAVQAELDRAFADAGWTKDRYSAVDDIVGQVLSALDDIDRGGDDAKNGQDALAELDKTTVATVKAHRKELNDPDERQRANKQVRDEAETQRRGLPPDPAKILGTWVFDLEATVNTIAGGLGDEAKAQLRQTFQTKMPAATYTFGPGNTIVSSADTIEKTGDTEKRTTRTDKGTYRLEGNKLFVKSENSKREQSVDIGMKNDQLLIGMFGMYSVFRKQP